MFCAAIAHHIYKDLKRRELAEETARAWQMQKATERTSELRKKQFEAIGANNYFYAEFPPELED